jgi:PIN domain nuclease of toxin-antitoxin system
MNFLLDTHTFIWFAEASVNLSPKAMQLIEELDNNIYFSIASIWEMGIKYNIGKLQLTKPFNQIYTDLAQNNIKILALDFSHVLQYTQLELHHRDPFDRIIIAQSIVENLEIISRDKNFDDYDITRIW